MNRRKLLVTLAGAGLTSISGCNAVQSTARTGPPYFEEVEISGPTQVAVSEEFEIDVSAKNTGGKTGDFTTTLSIGEDPFTLDRSVKIEDVKVTKTESKTVSDLYSDYATELRFRITDYDAEHTVSVETREMESGEEITTQDGVSLSANGIAFERSLLLQDGDSRSLLYASPNHLLALVHFAVSYTDENPPSIRSSLGTNRGEEISEVSLGQFWFEDIVGLQRDRLNLSDSSPGERVTGWKMFEVPIDEISSLSAEWDHDSTDEIEAAWNLNVEGYPLLEADLSLPKEVEARSRKSVQGEVHNNGDKAGTYRYGLRTSDGDEGLDAWGEVEVEPGAKETIELDIYRESLGSVDYEFFPAEVSQTIEFMPTKRQFKEAYESPTGLRITPTIGGMNFDGFSDSYAYETYSGNERVHASSGMQFLFIGVSIKSTGDSQYPPDKEAFSVLASDVSYPVTDSEDWGLATFTAPYHGDEYVSRYENGQTQWLLFEVPTSVSAGDLTLRYRNSEYNESLEEIEYGADWSN
jgi:hypothetical protein